MRRGFSSAFGSVCKAKRIRSGFGDPAGEGLPPHPYHQQKSAQYIDYKGPSGDASRRRVRNLLILMAIEVKYNKQRGGYSFSSWSCYLPNGIRHKIK
jgi:hypothetical protein